MLRTCENKRQCFKVYHHCSGSIMGLIKTITGVFLWHSFELELVLALLWKSIRTIAAFMFSNNGQR